MVVDASSPEGHSRRPCVQEEPQSEPTSRVNIRREHPHHDAQEGRSTMAYEGIKRLLSEYASIATPLCVMVSSLPLKLVIKTIKNLIYSSLLIFLLMPVLFPLGRPIKFLN